MPWQPAGFKLRLQKVYPGSMDRYAESSTPGMFLALYQGLIEIAKTFIEANAQTGFKS